MTELSPSPPPEVEQARHNLDQIIDEVRCNGENPVLIDTAIDALIAAVRAESSAITSRGAAAEEALSIALAQNRAQSSALAAELQRLKTVQKGTANPPGPAVKD